MDTNINNRRKGRVFITLQGGLGNQLFQLCAGLQLLDSTNKHVFFVKHFNFKNGTKRRSLAIKELLLDAECSKYLSTDLYVNI